MSDEIGARLINERNRLDLSQLDIAKIVGIRREMWARYESGAEPGAKVLSKMHEIGIDVLYVLTGQRNSSMNSKQYLVAEDNYVGSSLQETALSTIGSRLKSERIRIGLSQNSLAEIGGVQRRAQINYESDSRSPDGLYLEAISKAGIDVLYVLTGQRNPSMNSKQHLVAEDNYVGPSLQETTLLNNYREADESGKEVIEKTSAAFAAASKEKKRTG